MAKSVKVAAAQLAPVFFERERTVLKACDAIAEAGRNGAALVAFPESFIAGYPYFALALPPKRINGHLLRLREQAVEIPSPTMDLLCNAAREAGCHVVMGVSERDGGTVYNTQVFIDADGQMLGRRRKLVPTSHERLVWGRGDGSDLQVHDTRLGRIGGLICYEHSNALFRYALHAQGEQIHIANWPGGMSSLNGIMDAATRSYAFEAQAFVISVTSVFTEEALAQFDPEVRAELSPHGGYSAIVSPKGEYLVSPRLEGEALLYATLDFTLIDRLKSVVDSGGHYARPDVVQLLIDRSPQRSIVDRTSSADATCTRRS
jgi:predicted amidohydrolase